MKTKRFCRCTGSVFCKVRRSLKVLLFFVFLSFLYPISSIAGGTTLALTDGGTHSVGDNFNVDVVLKTGGTSICSIKAYLSFPSDLLSVESLSPGPVFSLEAVKKFSNQDGTISYTLAPGGGCTTSDTTVYRVGFKSKSSGSGDIKFSSTTVGAADSSGIARAIMVGTNNASFTVTGASSSNNTNEAIDNQSGANQNINKNKNSSTSSSAVTTTSSTVAPLVNDEGLTTPVLKKVEFDSGAVFDKQNKKSKGVNFYGSASPNSKVNIWIGKSINLTSLTDANGDWIIRYDGWLTDGIHVLTAQCEKDNKSSSQLITSFVLSSQKNKIALGSKLPGARTTFIGNAESKKLSTKMLGMIIIFATLIALIILMVIYYKLKKKHEQLNKGDKLVNNNINNQGGL